MAVMAAKMGRPSPGARYRIHIASDKKAVVLRAGYTGEAVSRQGDDSPVGADTGHNLSEKSRSPFFFPGMLRKAVQLPQEDKGGKTQKSPLFQVSELLSTHGTAALCITR